ELEAVQWHRFGRLSAPVADVHRAMIHCLQGFRVPPDEQFSVHIARREIYRRDGQPRVACEPGAASREHDNSRDHSGNDQLAVAFWPRRECRLPKEVSVRGARSDRRPGLHGSRADDIGKRCLLWARTKGWRRRIRRTRRGAHLNDLRGGTRGRLDGPDFAGPGLTPRDLSRASFTIFSRSNTGVAFGWRGPLVNLRFDTPVYGARFVPEVKYRAHRLRRAGPQHQRDLPRVRK